MSRQKKINTNRNDQAIDYNKDLVLSKYRSRFQQGTGNSSPGKVLTARRTDSFRFTVPN